MYFSLVRTLTWDASRALACEECYEWRRQKKRVRTSFSCFSACLCNALSASVTSIPRADDMHAPISLARYSGGRQHKRTTTAAGVKIENENERRIKYTGNRYRGREGGIKICRDEREGGECWLLRKNHCLHHVTSFQAETWLYWARLTFRVDSAGMLPITLRRRIVQDQRTNVQL